LFLALGIDLAMRHTERVGKVFAFAANTVTSGRRMGSVLPTGALDIGAAKVGFFLTPSFTTPKDYDSFVDQFSKM
jgi:hypothetical protein